MLLRSAETSTVIPSRIGSVWCRLGWKGTSRLGQSRREAMRPDPFLPAPTSLLLLLATACAGTAQSHHAEQFAGPAVAEPPPTPPLRGNDLVGQWRMQPKEENAIVP